MQHSTLVNTKGRNVSHYDHKNITCQTINFKLILTIQNSSRDHIKTRPKTKSQIFHLLHNSQYELKNGPIYCNKTKDTCMYYYPLLQRCLDIIVI